MTAPIVLSKVKAIITTCKIFRHEKKHVVTLCQAYPIVMCSKYAHRLAFCYKPTAPINRLTSIPWNLFTFNPSNPSYSKKKKQFCISL